MANQRGRPRTSTGETGETVKTTVELPEALWQAAKMRAITERTDLRAVVIAALAAYLKTKAQR